MKRRNPRHGSMQFWPRVRAKREHARVRSWTDAGNGLLGFAGYKVGMTHVLFEAPYIHGKVKGTHTVSEAVTILECPPLKVMGVRTYASTPYGPQASGQVLASSLDKSLTRRITIPKKNEKTIDDLKEVDDLVLIVHTQPGKTGIGKKKPEIFEVAIGGKKEEKLAYAKEMLGKEIAVGDVFKEGQQVDIHSVTTGRGFQGPVKRFGITLRSHKSEKSRRNPGSLGGWISQGHVMYRVAHAGQTGYHQRTEHNKQLLRIGEKAEEVTQKGGFHRYGTLKNTYVLLRGSIPGPKKRLIKLSHASRPRRTMSKEAPSLLHVSTASKQ